MLKNLKKEKLIKPTTSGQKLTKKGEQIIETINNHISYPKALEIKPFTLHENNIAYKTKNIKKKITNGQNERDHAIKMGADGLITLRQKDNHELTIAGEKKIKPPPIIKETFKPEKDDIILITFAKKKSISELAGLAVALELIDFKLDT